MKPKMLLAIMVVGALGGLTLLSVVQMVRLKQQMDKERHTILSLTEANDGLQQQLKALEQQRQELERQRRELEQHVKSAQEHLALATDELTRFRQTIADLQERYTVLEESNAHLKAQAGRLMSERDEAREEVRRAEEERQQLARSVGRLRLRYELLDRDYQQLAQRLSGSSDVPVASREADLAAASSAHPPASTLAVARAGDGWSEPSVTEASTSSGATEAQRSGQQMARVSAADPTAIELPPIVVRRHQPTQRQLPVEARLVEVNDVHQFVVIDKGQRHGIATGMTFDILRPNGGVVGQAIVVRVRPTLAACNLIVSQTLEPVQVGDLAIQRSF